MKLFFSNDTGLSITSTDLLQRPLWNRHKINFYFSVNPNTKEEKLENYTFSAYKVELIEKSQQFNDFNNLTYEEMMKHLANSKVKYSKITEQLMQEIINIPHNDNISNEYSENEIYIVMVDGSKKQNGQQLIQCAASCIRNTKGNIIASSVKDYSEIELSTTLLELLSIKQGIELARENKIKNYTLASDCSGNVFKIHQALNGFTLSDSDFKEKEETYIYIINSLIEDNAKIAYIPRKFNNIADHLSKTYIQKLSVNFENSREDILKASEDFFNSESLETDKEIYFYHKNINAYLEKNPFNLDKNMQKNLVYNIKEHGEYDVYLLPFYSRLERTYYNCSIDPINNTYEVINKKVFSQYPTTDEQQQNTIDFILSYPNKKIALFDVEAMAVKSNLLTPLVQKDLEGYKKIYHAISQVKEISMFTKKIPLIKIIEKAIDEELKKNPSKRRVL